MWHVNCLISYYLLLLSYYWQVSEVFKYSASLSTIRSMRPHGAVDFGGPPNFALYFHRIFYSFELISRFKISAKIINQFQELQPDAVLVSVHNQMVLQLTFFLQVKTDKDIFTINHDSGQTCWTCDDISWKWRCAFSRLLQPLADICSQKGKKGVVLIYVHVQYYYGKSKFK